MGKMKVKGRFNYNPKKKKDKKKDPQKELAKKLLKREKEILRQCECNHIGRNDGKVHFKKVRDDQGNVIYNKCEICKDLMITDTSLLTKSAVEDAAQVISTVYGLARNKIRIDQSLNSDIKTCLYLVKKAPLIVEELNSSKKKNGKKRKNNSNKKKKNKRGRRERY